MLAWDKAVRGEHGGARERAGRKPAVAAEVLTHDPETGEIKAGNIRLENTPAAKLSSDYGTSAQAGLRRLEKAASSGDGNAADLLRRVANPDDPMTVNGACVAMGWPPARTCLSRRPCSNHGRRHRERPGFLPRVRPWVVPEIEAVARCQRQQNGNRGGVDGG